MPVATAYTESSLAGFMAQVLGTATDALEWETSGNDYQVPINRTLRDYARHTGLTLSSIADATDMDVLEALATYHAWRAAVDALSGLITHSVDQQSMSLGDLSQKQASAALQRASDDLRQLRVNVPAVEASSIDYSQSDPYMEHWPPPSVLGLSG